ncbi:MAG: sigma-54-dependent Fis family transcriptional regulator [Planctomycetota bacterium]|nr:MAG: sigma-54-dependent Fis family transcriptional regulator [Planctomycetota bacterium]
MSDPARSPADRRPHVLVVDDDPIVADSLAEFLDREGCRASTCATGAEALNAVRDAADRDPVRVAICDLSLPDQSGLDTLDAIAEASPETVVVILTGYGTIQSAVTAIKRGAADYLTKPVIDDELRMCLEKALRQQALRAENHALKTQLDERFGLDNIVGHDHRMLRIYDLIEAVAPSRTTVLMTGESGVGKSLVARAIHRRSPRRDKPFVEIACGSIPETLLESELFGHVKGAFTGAHADKRGKFLAADGGTIFLDEINSASAAMQLKLLRVLQERTFEPVGSTRTVEVDARVVLASNQPLEDLVAAGEFRQDLYYRVNVVRIDVPPLRDRPGDIAPLAEHFIREHAREAGKQVTGLTDEALDALRRYPWPGNVRELSNAIERAVVLSRTPTLAVDDLPRAVADNAPPGALLSATEALIDDATAPWRPVPLAEALLEPERRIILKALRANGWNRQETARQLSINRTTLYKKMKQLGLDKLAG